MRNKIAFYIGDVRADLDNNSYLLLNYTAEDLSNPTIIRNSFSKQITLKGTPTNNKIFGEIYRNDRNTLYTTDENGAYFDPCRKTSFSIYNEAGELLESGYLKLDKVTKTKRNVEYTVTLYGGLGSFLYSLAYDSSGNKLSLADLTFDSSLAVTLNRTNVANAWEWLDGDTSQDDKWDIINFMPSYTGLPSGEFSADKALVYASSVGLPSSSGDYSTVNGWTLVTLPEKVTGNEAKDYRSYLQKPILRMKYLLDAIIDYSGYTVNLDSEFFTSSNPYYEDAWLTLPLFTDLNIDITTDSGTLTTSLNTDLTISDGGVVSTLYAIHLKIAIETIFDSSPNYSQYVMHCEDDWAAGQTDNDNPGYYLNYLEFVVNILDSSDNVLDTATFRVSTSQAPEGYDQMDYVFDYINDSGEFMKDGTGYYAYFDSQVYGASKVNITKSVKTISWGNLRYASDEMLVFPVGYYDYTMGETIYAYNLDTDNTAFTWSSVSSATARTGVTISQAELLSSEHTPADYLLSYCKMFGLQIVPRKGQSIVDIVLRKNLYDDSTTIDLSGRIDRGKAIEKVPYSFDARWYLFGNDAHGEYADYYANKYGMPFGQYRVNTGYDFNSDERTMTDSIIFGNACDVMETSKYYCDLVDTDGTVIPSVFLDGGKYTLYKAGGETQDFDIPIPLTATKQWNNPSYPMHDDWPKMQFHTGENGHLDERDTLVFFNGIVYPYSDYVSLTDDTRVMLQLNGNSPCWLPGYSIYDSSWQLAKMPKFTRHIWNVSNVTKSWDFGTPSEAQIPGIAWNSSSNIYSQYWSKYIADRYDDDSAVVTAWVDLRGMKVDETLLRQFYYFDGAVWAMNRIINHSLTTAGPTQCEFVKVQDTDNYTS